MAYLIANSGFSDTYFITVSMWFRVQQPSHPSRFNDLITFNTAVATKWASFTNWSSIQVTVGNEWPTMGMRVNVLGHKPDEDLLGSVFWFNDNLTPFAYSAWHHIMVAIDSTLYYPNKNSLKARGDGIVATNEDPAPSGPEHAFLINLSTDGYVALPQTPSITQYENPVMEFADVQVWFGTVIDPTSDANFAKFINITGGRGYPVNPSTAAAAFGIQTILFKGKASDSSFYFNRGNGGSFTKIGTITDFTPIPSYG